jgi:ankyrin repeat protein
MRIGDALAVASWVDPERVKRMLQAGADVKKSAALHVAAAAGSVSLTRRLLAAGASVDRVDDRAASGIVTSASTALCLAARADAVDVAELLCGAGAAVDPVDGTGQPLEHGPLAVAAEHGSIAMVGFLGGKGAKLDMDLDGPSLDPCDPLLRVFYWPQCNPLDCALRNGHYDAATLLIGAGANFNEASSMGLSMAPFARTCELIEIGRDRERALALADLMIERGLRADGCVMDCFFAPGTRPIYAAIASGEPRLVSALIAAGANVRGWVDGDEERSLDEWKLDFDGEIYKTPLEFASARGCPEIVAMISDAL